MNQKSTYNPSNILELYNILVQVRFTNKTKLYI